MLIESEHNMAREDKDGSATDVEFTTMSPLFVSEVLSRERERATAPFLTGYAMAL
jgi:hypothetical protein